MGYTIDEFAPAKPVLKIDSLELTLSFVTLQHNVIMNKKYGSLASMYDSMKEEPLILFDVIFLLLEDKNLFKNSSKKFQNFIFSAKSTTDVVAKEMSECLDECVSLSMPIVKNVQRAKDINDMNTDKSQEPCYVEYFDIIAKRYGYTIEDFYKLTLRQIHLLLKTIDDKMYDELEIQAALQGKKLKPKMKVHEITEEEDKAQEAQAMEMLRSLQKKYQENQAKE